MHDSDNAERCSGPPGCTGLACSLVRVFCRSRWLVSAAFIARWRVLATVPRRRSCGAERNAKYGDATACQPDRAPTQMRVKSLGRCGPVVPRQAC